MTTTVAQYEYNSGKGHLHEDESSLPEHDPSSYPVRYIAYYLPQFYVIPENERTWGAGFTEWTNVTKALPRYVGHYQPRLPADLGFYNLTDVETIRRQADLAKRGGIYGFCIHHYWFSGTEILDKPLKLILDNPDIDIPFCLNWANENWSKRWDGSEKEIIIAQRHLPEDGTRFAQSILRAVKDPRYIRIGDRPLLMIYRPNLIPEVKKAVADIRAVFRREGLGDPYILMPLGDLTVDPDQFGVDATAGFPPHKVTVGVPNHRRMLDVFDGNFMGMVLSYDQVASKAAKVHTPGAVHFPGVVPGWDNEARRTRRGLSLYGSTPEKYTTWLSDATRQACKAEQPEERIVFINAWNEWAEGAYLEPDRHYGYAYLAATRRCLDACGTGSPVSSSDRGSAASVPRHLRPEPSLHRYPLNFSRDLLRRLRRYLGLRAR